MSVRIDLDELTEAFADASPSLNYYVDRESGEVILVSDTLGFIEAGLQRIEMSRARGRYLPVPVSGVNDLSDDLESFIDDLNDEAIGAALDEVLEALDPAKSLATILAKHDELAAAWSEHRERRIRDRAQRWSMEHGFTT